MLANYMVRTGEKSFHSIIYLRNREVEFAFDDGTIYATVISFGEFRLLKKNEAEELYNLFGLNDIMNRNNEIGGYFEFNLDDDLDWEKINRII